MVLGFYSPHFSGFKSPGIDENSGHRGRRVPLYQERRRTWSVVAGGNMTKTGMIYSSPPKKQLETRKLRGTYPWNPHGRVCLKIGCVSKCDL